MARVSRQVKFLFFFLLAFSIIMPTVQICHKDNEKRLKFQLVRQCKRSIKEFIALENTQTLEECMLLATKLHGLALNYSPQARRRGLKDFVRKRKIETNYTLPPRRYTHFLNEPEKYFNCHVLACPENSTLRTMVNDSRFDYFSLYAPLSMLAKFSSTHSSPSKVSTNYSCLPEVGIIQLQIEPLSFSNASLACRNSSIFKGVLAHVAAEIRTTGISAELGKYNELHRHRNQSQLSLAYVGLHINRSYTMNKDFHTSGNESLNCFNYRAWSPGYPKRVEYTVSNTSCVAITMQNTWITLDCDRKLPYFCDIDTLEQPLENDFDISATVADQCVKYIN